MITIDSRSGHFLKALARIIPENVDQHFNKRATTVTTTREGRVRIGFADGGEHVADLVIGADGIKSAVRAQGVFAPLPRRDSGG